MKHNYNKSKTPTNPCFPVHKEATIYCIHNNNTYKGIRSILLNKGQMKHLANIYTTAQGMTEGNVPAQGNMRLVMLLEASPSM